MKGKSYDSIIIGGGPAGITAGIYLARKKINFLLLTKDLIGQIGKTSEVDNYPGLPGIKGMDLIKRFENHLKKTDNFEIRKEEVVKVEKSGTFRLKTEKRNLFQAKTIIVASGAVPRFLEIPGEKEFSGRGVSYCPICDAPFFKDKKVAVIGGGNAGFEAALDLTKYAREVFLFELLPRPKADQALIEQAEKKDIKIKLNKKVEEIKGEKEVESIRYKDVETGEKEELAVQGVFIEIGSVPVTGFLKGLVDFNEKGEIKVDPRTFQSSDPGLFAIGDVNDTRWKQVVIAAGQGAEAALNLSDYLEKND